MALIDDIPAQTRQVLSQITALPPEFQAAGSYGPDTLLVFAYLASRRPIEFSAETGCGATTLLLSHISRRHVAFTLDIGHNQPTFDSPLLDRSRASFVLGPTQVTLPAYRFDQPLDFALIDGPHGFPFPQLEYYYFYPALRTGALFVLDDIHIPIISHMFAFMREDAMFQLLAVQDKTAFFERTPAPTTDPLGDEWYTQAYNEARFPLDAQTLGPVWPRTSVFEPGTGKVRSEASLRSERLGLHGRKPQ